MRRFLRKFFKKHKPVVFSVTVFCLLLLVLVSAFQILKATLLPPVVEEEAAPKLTVVRDGKEYFPRQDITTVLVLGIDRSGPVEDSGSYQNPGAADLALILAFDQTEGTCDVLQFNRDSMVEMPVLGLGGKPAGTDYAQLALCYTYGSGLEDSCENAKETVSRLLYGLQIDYYVAMHMDAIPIFNDAVGGVTVEVTEDFSQVDASLPMGTVTLSGDQAVTFVRSRKGVGDQLNLSRIDRQQAYAQGFIEAFNAKQSKGTRFLMDAYEKASPYLITNCSPAAINAMVERYGNYKLNRILTPPGENILGEQYYEFHIDEKALDKMILELFYAEKE